MHVAFSSFVLFILWRKHITRKSSEVNQRDLFKPGKPKSTGKYQLLSTEKTTRECDPDRRIPFRVSYGAI